MKRKHVKLLAALLVVATIVVGCLVYYADTKNQTTEYVYITAKVERYSDMSATDGPRSVSLSGGYSFNLGGGLTPNPFLGEVEYKYAEGDMVEVRAKLNEDNKLTVDCAGCYIKKK